MFLLHKFQCVSVHLGRYQAIPRRGELKVSTEKPGGKLPLPSMASSQHKPKQTAFLLLLSALPCLLHLPLAGGCATERGLEG